MQIQAILLLSLAVLGLNAQDWPQWRGPNRNGHASAAEHQITKLPEEPKIVWKLKIGPGLASPVVADDKVVYFDGVEGKEMLHAVNRETGEELWRRAVDETFHDNQGPDGPRCTPMIDGDRVYAVSCRGALDCLVLKDGSRVWGVDYVRDFGATFIGEKGNVPGAGRHGNNGSPLIHGDHLFAMAGGTNGSSVVCLDKRTGKVLWKSQNDLAAYAPPVIAELAGVSQLFCFTADGLISLAPKTGELYWRRPIETAFARHVTAPVWHNDVAVVSSHQAGMIAVKVTNTEGKLSMADAWVSKEAAMNFSSPVQVGGHLYGLGPRKNLECVEIASGKQSWSQEGYFQTSADKAHAGFLVIGENVLCLTDNGVLVMFKANPEKFEEVGTLQVAAVNWCNPAYADGILYLRDGNKGPGDLMAIDLR